MNYANLGRPLFNNANLGLADDNPLNQVIDSNPFPDNNKPVFSSSPNTSATEDSAYSYSITVTDADSDPITITAPTLPEWLTLTDNNDGTATLAGTPADGDVGTDSVVIRVSDGTTTVDQSFNIVISAASPVAGATLFRIIMGQSNADGGTSVNNIAQDSYNFGDGKTGSHPPYYNAATVGGSNKDIVVDMRDMLFLKTGDSGVDRIEGAVSGPWGDVSLRNTEKNTGMMSAGYGMASAVKDGHHAGADKIVQFKNASWGVPITNFVPSLFGSSNFQTGNYAMRNWLRGFIESEKAAGRNVFNQVMFWAQGEAEASLARTAEDLSHPDVLAWQDRFVEVETYLGYKLGQPPIIVLNELVDEGDAYTALMNTKIEEMCRYTVPVNLADGSIGTIVDNGTSGYRASNRYYLNHGDTNGLHFTASEYEMLGRAVVNIEKTLESNGITSHEITGIAPAFIEGLALVDVFAEIIDLTVWIDEPCNLYVIALPDGSPTPTVAEIVSGGDVFEVTANNANIRTAQQTIRVSGLSEDAAYTLYAAAVHPTYGNSSMWESSLDVTTPAIISGVGTPFDKQYSSEFLMYSEDGYTVSRDNTLSVRDAKSLTGKSTGKYYVEIATGGVAIKRAGIANSDLSTYYVRESNFIRNEAGNEIVGRSVQAGDTYRIAYDRDNDLMWIADNAGDWNDDPSADPATSTGGFSVALTGDAHLYVQLLNDVTATAALATSDADWTYTAPSGFTTWQ